MDGLSELARRIEQLDAGPCSPLVPEDLRDDLAHFITVMERITSRGTGDDVPVLPTLSAAKADGLVQGSRLLARLDAAAPELVLGPLRRDAQLWTGTGNPSFLPEAELTPSESYFVGVSEASAGVASTKPFGVGLFTSTGVLGTYGMWRLYLELNRGSTLFPLPWRTWAVEPLAGAVVREIASAADWVELVLAHPRQDRGLLFPDWAAVARGCDGVHVTLRAIVAMQGMCCATREGTIAAPYWDVESTFWLRWCFGAVRLVETVG